MVYRSKTDNLGNYTVFALNEKKYQEFLAILDLPPQADEKLRTFLKTKSPWD